MSSTEELIKALRSRKTISNGSGAEVIPKGIANQAADALESLQSENKSLRNELCQRCGRYVNSHNGSCNSCIWKGKKCQEK